jgi:hypothetical protein
MDLNPISHYNPIIAPPNQNPRSATDDEALVGPTEAKRLWQILSSGVNAPKLVLWLGYRIGLLGKVEEESYFRHEYDFIG